MRVKQEINALGYAVCMLIVELNNLLFKKVNGWHISGRGFNLEIVTTEEEVKTGRTITVRIEPVGWQGRGYIAAKFRSSSGEWVPIKGEIHNQQLNYANTSVSFQCSGGLDSIPLTIWPRYAEMPDDPLGKAFFKAVAKKFSETK